MKTIDQHRTIEQDIKHTKDHLEKIGKANKNPSEKTRRIMRDNKNGY